MTANDMMGGSGVMSYDIPNDVLKKVKGGGSSVSLSDVISGLPPAIPRCVSELQHNKKIVWHKN